MSKPAQSAMARNGKKAYNVAKPNNKRCIETVRNPRNAGRILMGTDAIPLIRASQARPLLAAMGRIGTPRDRFLRQAKLPLLVYDDAEAVLPELFLWGLADNVARSEGIEDIGRFAATHTPLWQSEPEFVGSLQSLPTLWSALLTFCRMVRQVSTAVPYGIVRVGHYALLHRGRRPGIPGEDQAELYDLELFIQLVQLAGGQRWVPPEVHVSEVNARRLAGREEFDRVRIRPSDTCSGVLIPANLLALPMNALACPCGMPLSGPLADDFLGSLRAVIGTYLSDRRLNIQLAAEMAGLSKRTFQRRLKDLQLDYSALIDQVRLERALSILCEPDAHVTQIAYDLGYSDAAHFTRAFRRWTALSPREYRKQRQVA